MKLGKKIISAVMAFIVLVTAVNFSVFAYADDEASATVATIELTSYCDLTSHPVLKWKAVDGVKKYEIYRCTKKNGEYKKLADVASTSFTDKTAKEKKKYYYRVDAVGTTYSSEIICQPALKTVLVGDSIMEGVRAYKALPGGKFVVKVGVGPNSFYNYAYSEYKIKGKSAKGVDKVISMKPDRIIIMLGMNEIDWNSKSATIANYKKVLNKIKKKLPDAQIIVLATSPTAVKSAKGTPSMKKVNDYNKAVEALCSELELEYYDYTAVFKDSKGHLKKAYNGGDGCHWNKAGAKAFIKQLNKYVKKH